MTTPTPDRAALGARLRAAREAAGLSQQQVADGLGEYQSTVAFMEKGRRSVSALELAQLARMFGTTTDALLGITAPPSPPVPAAAPDVQGGGRIPHGLSA
jgi:transcriptional regulator with XRE-family HTH domain